MATSVTKTPKIHLKEGAIIKEVILDHIRIYKLLEDGKFNSPVKVKLLHYNKPTSDYFKCNYTIFFTHSNLTELKYWNTLLFKLINTDYD